MSSRFLVKIKVKPREFLYYMAFFLLTSTMMMDRSSIVELPYYVSDIVSVSVAILFVIKILLDKHKFRELLLDGLFIVVAIIIKIMGGPMFIVTSCLAFLAMKNVNIKTVVKIDIAIKSFFLLSHALVFLIDYMTGMEIVGDFIAESAKGTTISLYFVNPNTTGLIGTWIALELLYLKENKRVRDFIIPTLIVLVTFLVTTSRTPFFVYAVYLLLQLIRDGRKLAVLQKIAYPLFCVGTFVMVTFMTRDGVLFETLNSLTSGRIGYSLMAYGEAGFNLLPSVVNNILLEKYIIDVFYVKCFVEYGVVTMGLYYLPHLLMPLNSKNEDKRMSIIVCVYLFFERAMANVGIAMPYLIIADSIFNRKDEIHVE